MANTRRTALWSGLLALSILCVLVPRANLVAHSTQACADEVTKSALAVYVTLRALNAVMSTAQEVEVSGQFVVGGSAQPLKALEPIDDTIERVASAVFVVLVISAVLSISSVPTATVGAALAALSAILMLFGRNQSIARLGRTATMYGVLLALVLPAIITSGGLAGEALTRPAWEKNDQIIQEITQPLEVDVLQDQIEVQEGFLSRIRSGAGEAIDRVRAYSDLAQGLYANADQLIVSYLSLLAIFIFQVVVLPAVTFLGCFLALRHLPGFVFGLDARDRTIG